MADQSAEEAKKQYIEKMGEPLGTQFHALWQEIDYLLGDGLKEKSEREKRIEQGEIRENDIPEQI